MGTGKQLSHHRVRFALPDYLPQSLLWSWQTGLFGVPQQVIKHNSSTLVLCGSHPPLSHLSDACPSQELPPLLVPATATGRHWVQGFQGLRHEVTHCSGPLNIFAIKCHSFSSFNFPGAYDLFPRWLATENFLQAETWMHPERQSWSSAGIFLVHS